jgi:hypothetical protein
MTPPLVRLCCILLLCWISAGQPEEVSIDVTGEVEGAPVRWTPWRSVASFPPSDLSWQQTTVVSTTHAACRGGRSRASHRARGGYFAGKQNRSHRQDCILQLPGDELSPGKQRYGVSARHCYTPTFSMTRNGRIDNRSSRFWKSISQNCKVDSLVSFFRPLRLQIFSSVCLRSFS